MGKVVIYIYACGKGHTQFIRRMLTVLSFNLQNSSRR